ncbi:hypothetical protein D3C73_1259180 [compost metagenome]
MCEVPWHRCTAKRAAAADLDKYKRFVETVGKGFQPRLLLLPGAAHILKGIARHSSYRIIGTRSDIVNFVEPVDAFFFTMVRIVHNRPCV